MNIQVDDLEEHCFVLSEHTQLQRGQVSGNYVVVKNMRIVYVTPELELDEFTERFRQYGETSMSFDHVNIRRTIGLSRCGRLLRLVSPYSHYGDVVSYLKSHRKSNNEKIGMAKAILTGLAYLHGRNVIHGSVHAENVLIDDDEEVVLCDAQMHTVRDFELNGSHPTPIPSKCWWLPFERLVAERVDDDVCPLGAPSNAADIYGAAVTIIQLWTLQRPYSCMRHGYQLIWMLRELKAGVLRVHRPAKVPEHVWKVLQDCLSVNPHARPDVTTLLNRFGTLQEEGP